MIELHDIVVLERGAVLAGTHPLPDGYAYRELHAGDAAAILDAARAHGRRADEQRVRRRFAQGLRHFMVEQAGEPIAWTWVVDAGRTRYFDELRWAIRLAQDQVWVRDAFVAPGHRGRRLMPGLFEAASIAEGRPLRYLSDVDAINMPSLHMHRRLGFRRVCRVRALALGERLCVRVRPPAALPPPEAIRPQRRWLWLDADELAWHRAHIA